MSDMANLNERYLVSALFLRYRDSVREQPFTSEVDRWMDLMVSLLLAVGHGAEEDARAAANIMASLDLTSVPACAQAVSGTAGAVVIERILCDHGFSPEDAATSRQLIGEVAQALQRQWDGKIQRYLRACGEQMLRDLARAFPVKVVSESVLRHAFTHWLQSALGLPMVLAEPAAKQYATQQGTTLENLVAAADALDLNVALLDDAIGCELAARTTDATERLPRDAGPR